MSDALTDELLLMSYSFNDGEPRLYSKYNAQQNPNTYNLSLAQAAEATSAAPIYFDPKVIVNGWGQQEVLIDGGVIANNPSLYAFILATEFHNKENIRIVSVGTGTQNITFIDPTKISQYTWIENLSNLLIDVEVSTNAYLSSVLSNDFHRFQTITDLALDAVDGE